jgi:hypothetical protein
MSLALKCIEPVTAIGCALAAVAVGALDAGITAGAMIGGAGLLARFREHGTKPGLDDGAMIEKMQKVILRSMDRWDTDQDTRDAVTLADAAMARILPEVMLSREELAASSVSLEVYPDRAARLVAERLAEQDAMFVPGSIACTFATDVIKTALNAAKDDPTYAALLTADLVIVGNQAHALTHQKIDIVIAKLDGGEPTQQLWIDHRSGHALADLGIPPVGASSVEIAAKAQLYGGKPVLKCAPLDFVALGHTFDRETVKELSERIRESDRPCSSFTLKARRGSGLSLALAQLVRDFSADERVEVVSVIGERQRTLELLESLDEKTQPFIAWVRSLPAECERVLIVIDDVWGERPIGDVKLVHFRNRCSQAFAGGEGPKLTFVFGSFGAAKTLDEDGEIPLRLTDADRAACYAKMAVAQPTIINGYVGDPPPEARQLGDDAQALIDFHLQYGRPHRSTVEHWLARVDDLLPAQQGILATVATAELLDLAIPEAVATALCEKRGVTGLADAEEIVAANNRLTILDEAGPAVGLSCPWRAKSILQRMERLATDFLQATFQEMIEAAFADFEARGQAAAESLDFARHILQRLGKREYYPVPDKAGIGRFILARLLARLTQLSKRLDIADRAKWAGTIAVWADAPRSRTPEDAEHRAFREQCAELVGRLAEKCLFAVGDGTATLSPRLAVSLLRASRRLLSSGLHRDQEGEAGKSRRLAEHLDYQLSRIGIPQLLQLQLEEEVGDRAYRANELLTSYCGFRADLHVYGGGEREFPSQPLCREMSALILDASNKFGRSGVEFDAGTWIECARYVWAHPYDERQRGHACRARAARLEHAESCVRLNPVTMATWEDRVKVARNRLVRPLYRRPHNGNARPHE